MQKMKVESNRSGHCLPEKVVFGSKKIVRNFMKTYYREKRTEFKNGKDRLIMVSENTNWPQ